MATPQTAPAATAGTSTSVRGVDLGGLTPRAVTSADGAVPEDVPRADQGLRGALKPSRTGPEQVLTVQATGSMAGVTWSAGRVPADGTTVYLRGRGETGWSEWVPVEVLPMTDPAGSATKQRVGTDPAWLGPFTTIQARFATSAAPAVMTGSLQLVDAPTAATVAAADPAPSAKVAGVLASRPSVVFRGAWGANESLRNCGPSYSDTTKAAVVHHTAGTNSYTRAQSASIVRGILAYHTQSLGWCDVGYNALVDKYGQVFEGRYGGLDRTVLGAHALGFNTDTFGVSLLGTYTSVEPSSAAISSLQRIIAWRMDHFYVYGNHTTKLTSGDSGSRFTKGTVVTLPRIFGHRDTYYTECPGTRVWTRLPAIRRSVSSIGNYGQSAVYQAWSKAGGAGGTYGAVSSGEAETPWGQRTIFTSGWGLWSTSTGVKALHPNLARYFDGGRNAWGAPLKSSSSVSGGQRVDTSAGYSITWAPSVGARRTNGAIRTYWVGRGATGSDLRFPSADLVKPTATGYTQKFQGGLVTLAPSTGAHAVAGALLTKLTADGGVAGYLGFPRQDAQLVDGTWGIRTTGGGIWYRPGTGTFTTRGAINARYVSLGGPASDLGYPLADEVATATGSQSVFEGGRITWTKTTGATAVILD